MNFTARSYQKELLDGDAIPFAAIKQNMRELDVINSLLGGHAITVAGFRQLTGNNKHWHICEIGCGGGDNLYAIQKHAARQGIAVQLTGIDINADCIAVAAEKLNKYEPVLLANDYRNITWQEKKPDIIFSSLFCHHFTNEELVHQLKWMQQHCTTGFFINDLHRHALAYYAIKWLTRIFSRSYLVKNDAPLSVQRGFTRKEWEQLLTGAGITNYSVKWKWAFRWLIVVNKTGR